ncbi:MAG: redox-regulated ATPase YchF [Nanoarchaeota archaeon]
MLIGIVAKPNTGKSTFFKAATLADVAIGNRPFVTIKPNTGVAYVRVRCPEKDFKVKCNPRFGYCVDGQRFVPINLMDVPGLAVGAHEGRGLGYEFLNDLSQADALIHVIDIAGSTNQDGEPVPVGSYDPLNDIEFLETEIDHWFYGILTKAWNKFAKKIAVEKKDLEKEIARQFSGLKIKESHITKAVSKLNLDKEKPDMWKEGDLRKFCSELRRASKPMTIAANKIDKGGDENLERLRKKFPGYKIIACSADSELALREASKAGLISYIPGNNDFDIKRGASEDQKKALEFIRERVLKKYKSTGVQQVLDEAVFSLLGYIAIFPGGVNKLEDKDGNVLPDCFLLPGGSTALDFAYKIHQDIGNNFVKAMDARKKIALGKEHKLNNLDVIEIKTSK